MANEQLIAEGLTLTERLAFAPSIHVRPSDCSNARLRRWESALYPGNAPRFDAYLDTLGMNRDGALRFLGSVETRRGARLPNWTSRCPSLMETFRAIPETDSENPRAYANLFHGFHTLLPHLVSEPIQNVFSISVLRNMAAAAVRRSVQYCKPTLNASYTGFLAAHGGAEREPNTRIDSGAQIEFLKWLREGELLSTLNAHPALLRAVALLVDQWVDFVEELGARLVQDRWEIQDRFFSGNDPLQIASVQWPVSDYHQNGKAAAILRFRSGRRLVYKPRSLSLDFTLKQVLLALEEPSPSWIRAIPDVLVREDYGWAEYLETASGPSNAPIQWNEKALGDLLATAQLFGATDLHVENLGCVDGAAVPWDLETFLRPRLPVGQTSPMLHPDWRRALQDFEHSIMGIGILSPQNNRNRMGVSLEGPDAWQDLEDAYRSRMDWASQRSVPDLSKLESSPVRFVHRPTKNYHDVLMNSWTPEALRSGVDWELAIDVMIGFRQADDPVEIWVAHAERRAMTNLDIPAFWIDSSNNALVDASSQNVLKLDDRSTWAGGCEIACERWRRAPQEIGTQLRHIHFLRDQSVDLRSIVSSPWGDSPGEENLEPQLVRAIEHLSRTAAGFIQQGHRLSAGISLSGEWRLAPAPPGFYQGSTGLALFWAAAGCLLDKPDYIRWAKAALEPLIHDLQDATRRERLTAYLGLGGALGMPSVLYCLTVMNQLMNDPALREAQDAILKIPFKRMIESDRVFDVIGGAAGAILSWLACHRRTGRPEALHWAQQGGLHLLKNNPAPKGGVPNQNPPPAGMSHGASGFALALARLGIAAKDARFLEESQAWLHYENGLFLPDSGHWKDLRQGANPERDKETCAWCNGAAGIALARQAMTVEAGLEAPHIQESLRAAQEFPMQNQDHLCCGNFGRLDILHTLAAELDLPDLSRQVKQRAIQRLELNSNGFQWPAGGDADNLGFFTGIAGIGYTLLRILRPGTLPCALRWD